MSVTKKFLDATGLTYLAGKLNQFPTNELLGTVINAIDEVKADVDSPHFTGTPTAPTPTHGDSSNKIATTAFVMAAMQGSIQITIVNGFAGLRATATISDNSYSNSAVANEAGVIVIPVDHYGDYRISYSDIRVKGDTYASVNSNVQVNLAARYTTLVEYTVRIDETNSNPETSCVYMDDAVGMTKGSSNWDTTPIFEDIKPCVFQNGAVNYYLKPDDWNYQIDGETAANLDGTDGDVMIEFRKFAYKIKREGQYLYVSITNDDDKAAADPDYTFDAFSRLTEGDLDKFYQGAYKGFIDSNGQLRSIAGQIPTHTKNLTEFRAAAQSRNTVEGVANTYHYQQATYAHLKALQCLYLIKYGNRNGQTALGRGVVDFASNGADGSDSASSFTLVTGYDLASIANTGTSGNVVTVFDSANPDSTKSTADKGMDWAGTTNGKSHMKLFGIEDFWGNIYEWVDGFRTDTDRNILTTWTKNFGEPVTAVENSLSSGLTENLGWGYVSMVSGTTDSGFMGVSHSAVGGVNASSTTFWADAGHLYASCVLYFGGSWYNGDYAGPFFLYVNIAASHRDRRFGGRLSYN